MSITGKFIAANGSAQTIGGVYSAHADATVEKLDRTTAPDGGFGISDAGVADLTVDIKGYIDVGASAYSPVYPGALVSNMSIPVTANGTVHLLDLPLGLAVKFSTGGEIRGKLEFSAQVVNKGTFTLNLV